MYSTDILCIQLLACLKALGICVDFLVCGSVRTNLCSACSIVVAILDTYHSLFMLFIGNKLLPLLEEKQKTERQDISRNVVPISGFSKK